MGYPITPRDGTIGDRRRLRQKIRNTLGTTRDDPPSARTLVNAVGWLDELTRLTTSGRFRVTVLDRDTPVSTGEAHDVIDETGWSSL